MVAHGASRGIEGVKETSRGAAKERGTAFFFRPIWGLAIFTPGPHGSPREPSSNAAPQLFLQFLRYTNFDMRPLVSRYALASHYKL
jgi:hypothetical protein